MLRASTVHRLVLPLKDVSKRCDATIQRMEFGPVLALNGRNPHGSPYTVFTENFEAIISALARNRDFRIAVSFFESAANENAGVCTSRVERRHYRFYWRRDEIYCAIVCLDHGWRTARMIDELRASMRHIIGMPANDNGLDPLRRVRRKVRSLTAFLQGMVWQHRSRT